MSDTQKHKKLNVPNLRFPGFEGEWEKKRIEDIGKFFSGGTPSSSRKDYYGGEIPFIRSGEIHSDKTELFLTQAGYKNSSAKTVEIGDLLLALYGANSGDISISQMHGAINQAILCIRTNVAPVFFKSVWEKHTQKILNTYLQGGQGNLSADIVKKITIFIPSRPEQTKIAALFSLLDERITVQNKLIEDLRILKKAIMARLFQSSEGEMKTLGELTVNFSNRNKQRIPYPMFSVTNDKGFIPQSEQFEDREMEGEDIAAYKLIHTGDIAYNPARINVGSIAQYKGKATCMISSLYVCIKAKKTVSDRWLMHILKSERLLYYYNLYAEGGVRLYLFYPNFSRIKVFAPPYAKQEIIADCLDAIEKKVEQESVLLNDLMKQKQFFLSRLFL